jgi:hypothetical protein
MRRSVTGQEAASMAIAGFAVAIAVYAFAFIAYVNFTASPFGQSHDAPQLDARADGGLMELLNAPGSLDRQLLQGQPADDPWYKDPDKIKRFGLTYADRPGILDPDKLRNLTKGKMERDAANNALDYEEARLAMGIGDFDFHLRTYPLLPTLQEGGLKPIKGLDVAYVGDFTPVDTLLVANDTQDKGNFVFVNVTITNSGTSASMFCTTFDVRLGGLIAPFVDMQHTAILQPGETANTTLKLHKNIAWPDAGSSAKVQVQIHDSANYQEGDGCSRNGQDAPLSSFDIPLGHLDLNTAPWGNYGAIVTHPQMWSYRTNQPPRIGYDVFDGLGQALFRPVVRLVVRNLTTGVAVETWEGFGATSNVHQLPLTLPAGNYSITLAQPTDLAFNSTDYFVVTDGAQGEFTGGGAFSVESEASKIERSMVATLVDGWVNRTHDDAAGDVYRDLPSVLDGAFATALALPGEAAYDVVVVGSNVNHTAMTTAAARNQLAAWVRAGGLLVLLGAEAQDAAWLDPLFGASLVGGGGPLDVRDPTHPVLHAPEELTHATYRDGDRSWRLDDTTTAGRFTHVALRDPGTGRDTVLALSKPGQFGNGSIILTSWQLYSLTQPQVERESLATLYNFLLYALGYLYVDFGPDVPEHVEVGSSARIATAPHPIFKGERVLVRVSLHMFR